jgi:hypothetical protein
LNGFDGYSLGNTNQNILWPDAVEVTNSAKLALPLVSLPNADHHLHLNYSNENSSNCESQFSVQQPQQQQQLNPYNDILNCANSTAAAAALAAAKYSCAAAASTYGTYPFAVDEYNNSSVSQIQVIFMMKTFLETDY